MDESLFFADRRGRLPRREAIALADHILRKERKRRPVNIIVADDALLRQLNSRYRRKRQATDVLAFPADPELGILGEIYISLDSARRQAAEHAVTLREEILRLVCHGTLHLCGYDHRRRSDAAAMTARQERYLNRFFIHA